MFNQKERPLRERKSFRCVSVNHLVPPCCLTEPLGAMATIPTLMEDAWATSTAPPLPSPDPTVESTIEKERIIRDIIQLRDGLRGLLVRVTEIEGETERLGRDNEMLSVYIDNL